MDTERTEEYLEAIYKQQGKETPVSTSSLAKDLGVSPPAVTDMLWHLESKGFIDHKPGKGTILTDLGTERALSVVRRHRLWERFLTDILGMEWEKVHEEACKLEHAASPEVEERLAAILGDTDVCPHGHSIPDKNGNIKEEKAIPLSRFLPAQQVCIMAVDGENPEILEEIERLGLRPKVIVTIAGRNKDGSLELAAGNHKIRLDSKLSAVLLAEPVTTQKSAASIEEIPLSKLVMGQFGVLKSYMGGRNMLGRCLSLGFTPGSVVKMLENFNHGPVLVKATDTEIALGRELAEKITVTRNEMA